MKKAGKILAIGIVAMLVLGVGLAIAQAPSNGYVVINVPLSPEEREDVYHIPSGSIVYHSADGVTTVYTPNGKCILKARDYDAAMIATPHGALVPATHIIQSPSGSSASYEPFEFYTEDRGQISTRIATKIYAPDGTLILTLMSENMKEEPGFPTYDGWTGAAWWGPDANENYHRSSPIQVSVGDRLRGALEWYDSNEEWEILQHGQVMWTAMHH
ncbi:MAG: hypothetical protein ACXQTR_04160 [Candidatus Methanospirareceae archaeon]